MVNVSFILLRNKHCPYFSRWHVEGNYPTNAHTPIQFVHHVLQKQSIRVARVGYVCIAVSYNIIIILVRVNYNALHVHIVCW